MKIAASVRLSILILCLLLPGMSRAGWEKLFSSVPVRCYLAFDSVIVIGSDSGCYRSLNGGASWSFHEVDRIFISPQATAPLAVASLCRNDRLLFAATGASVYASSDTGETWEPLGPTAPDGRRLCMINVHALDSIILCTMAGGGLFRSVDNGATWSYLGPHRQYDHAACGTSLFAAAMDGIWCSRDSGATWTLCQGFPTYRMAMGITGSEGLLFADSFDLLYCSRDTGETWEVVDGMPPGGENLDGIFVTDGLLFAGLSDHRIVLSRDNGEQWDDISTGLDTMDGPGSLNRFTRWGGNVLSNKGGWLWSYDLSQVTDVMPVRESRPLLIELFQNYPNPFNPRTEIRSQVSEARHVKLAVYDLLGREVAVLVDEWRAPGTYHDTFSAGGRSLADGGQARHGRDGRRLASGLYIYRLTAGSTTLSRKMLLMK